MSEVSSSLIRRLHRTHNIVSMITEQLRLQCVQVHPQNEPTGATLASLSVHPQHTGVNCSLCIDTKPFQTLIPSEHEIATLSSISRNLHIQVFTLMKRRSLLLIGDRTKIFISVQGLEDLGKEICHKI